MRVRLPDKSKPDNYTESCMINVADIWRVEIPKPDGGVRKLGIPTVIDRTIQQAIAQRLMPIYEPLFIETSYGYRPILWILTRVDISYSN